MHLKTFAQLLSSAKINGVEQKLSAGSNNLNLSDFLSQSSGNSSDLWERIGGSASSFTAPCLNLKGNHLNEKTPRKGASLLDDAAMNLSSPLHANKYSIDAVPSTLLSHVTSTMEQLLQSRLRASMIALIRQTMKLGDHNEAKILRRLMLSQKAVQITTVVSSFSVLDDNGYGVFGNMMSKPLVYELILDITMLGKQHTVSIQASGDIRGVVNSNQLQFDSVTISLDTVSLLEKMMAQARQLIKKTLKRAATITTAYSKMQRKRSREEFERPQPEIQEKKPSAMQEDLSSYPAYFRETCKQFLPDENTLTDETMKGFPPQLAKTLKLLANGGGGEDCDELSESAQSNQPLISEDGLGMGFCSWMNSSASGSQESILRPLKKKKSKVSFSL